MKYLSLLLASFLFFACQKNQDKKTEEQQVETVSQNENQKDELLLAIAKAHGLEQWQDIKNLEFTFNIDREGKHFKRAWTWSPQTGDVQLAIDGEKTKFNLDDITDSLAETHQKFVNDKYWLLFPFQLVWDDGFTHETKKNIEAPISGKKMTQVRVQYNKADGYTPGDMYIIYVDSMHQIQEWGYYPGGQKEPATETTWEDYTTQKGIKIAQMHQNKDTSFKLYFTDLKIN